MSNSFATLWTVVHQAPLSMGLLRQEHWSGLPFSSLDNLSDTLIKPTSPALAVGFFATLPAGKPSMLAYNSLKDQQALCLDSKLIDMYLTEFEDTFIHTDFSYTDNTPLILLS